MESIQIDNKEINVKQYKNNWALALMSQGIIVKLTMSRWRATAPLNSEDLGLTFSDKDSFSFMKKYVSLGSEKLLPPIVIGEIEAVEARARLNLKNYSFDTVWGYFVPYTAFSKWEAENSQIKNDFMEVARRLGERYDEIVQMVRDEYRNMAKDVWKRLYPDSKAEANASFIEEFTNKIVCKIPDRMKIVSSFKYDATYFVIPMPSMIEEDISKVNQIKQEREIKEFEKDLEKETKRRISEEYIKRKQELIDGFLETTVVSMRKYIADLCDGVLQSIGRKNACKDITTAQKTKIKKMIERVNFLNFHNDQDIKNLLRDLEIEIDKYKGVRDKNIIVEKLQKIVETGIDEFTPSNYNSIIGSLEV